MLVLASASAIRRAMLEQAAIAHEVTPAAVDEAAIKRQSDDAPPQLARRLAEAKALAVSQARPGDWVIGSDSLVAVDGRMFDKPASAAQAAAHLRFFSGKTMHLSSAVALAHGGSVEWSDVDTAELSVRPLSEQFIQDYLEHEWPTVGGCVGAFRLEGPGVQLFESIEGSHFTVLGMPLLPLLAALRARGVIAS